MSHDRPELLFGGGGIGSPSPNNEFESADGVVKLFETFKKHGVTAIDTARAYGASETVIGESKAASQGFTIDTKWAPGVFPGQPSLTKDLIIANAKDSIQKLGVKQVDVFYMHCPEDKVSLDEQLEGINEVHKLGLFRRFGLSNYSATQVEEVVHLAESKSYVKPTVYQGLYSPVNRAVEKTLFPTLRRFGIAFRAYSPLAGGFLAKTRAGIEAGEGRFGTERLGPMYKELYHKSEYLDALDAWGQAADEEAISKVELALRWMAHHSALKHQDGDGVIVGSLTMAKLQETLQVWEKGPLSERAVQNVEKVWKIAEPVAYENNILAVQKVMSQLSS